MFTDLSVTTTRVIWAGSILDCKQESQKLIPGSGHYLNLVGSFAAEVCHGAPDYFMFDSVYFVQFFNSSLGNHA